MIQFTNYNFTSTMLHTPKQQWKLCFKEYIVQYGHILLAMLSFIWKKKKKHELKYEVVKKN